MDGSITDITNPNKFAPQYPGTCNLIYTLKGKNGKTGEVKIEKTIMPLDYNTIAISNIAPVNILPIIGQVESGDKQSYSHIEHLRIAEATRIRDMMWKYGAGSHTTAQYQQLMSRLNTGMIMEQPLGYDNYNII